MENINSDENKVSTFLYRIPEDAKSEILQALSMWDKFSIAKNQILLEKAMLAVKNPYSSTTNSNQNVTPNVIPGRQDKLDKVKNGISDFKFFLEEQINRADEESKLILIKTLESFNASIISKL